MQREENVTKIKMLLNNNHFLQGPSKIVEPFCQFKKKIFKNVSPRKRTDFETEEQFKLEATQPGIYNEKLYLTTSAVDFTCLELDPPRRGCMRLIFG